MKRHAILLQGMLCCACAPAVESSPVVDSPEATPAFPVPYDLGRLEVPAGRIERVDAVIEALRTASAKGDAEAVDALLGAPWPRLRARLLPEQGDPPTLLVRPRVPTPDGVRVELEGRSSTRRFVQQAYVGPDDDGQWRLFEEAHATQRAATMRALSARVWISPASAWLVGEATVSIEQAQRFVELRLRTRDASSPGVRVESVRVDGREASFASAGDRLVVDVEEARVPEIEVRYAGELGADDGADFIRVDDVVLRGESGWLPTVPLSAGRVDVEILLPSGYQAMGQGRAVETDDAPPGWSASRWVLEPATDFTLYAAPAYATDTFELAGASVRVALWPASKAALPSLVEALRGLGPSLGEYPFDTVNVVQTGFPGGYGALSNITLGSDPGGYAAEDLLPFFAHEFAHGWFPGAAIVPPGAGNWAEAFAEYAMTTMVEPSMALAERRRCQESYAALPAEADAAVTSMTGAIDDWQKTEAINYCKGSLILAALEDRVGASPMRAFLREVFASRAGRVTRWSDIADVARARLGPTHGDWLEAQVEAVGAPTPMLEHVVRDGDTLNVSVVSDRPVRVEVGVVSEDARVLASQWVDVQERADLELPRVDASVAVVLDPNARIPRRWNVDADPNVAGTRLPVPSP